MVETKSTGDLDIAGKAGAADEARHANKRLRLVP